MKVQGRGYEQQQCSTFPQNTQRSCGVPCPEHIARDLLKRVQGAVSKGSIYSKTRTKTTMGHKTQLVTSTNS